MHLREFDFDCCKKSACKKPALSNNRATETTTTKSFQPVNELIPSALPCLPSIDRSTTTPPPTAYRTAHTTTPHNPSHNGFLPEPRSLRQQAALAVAPPHAHCQLVQQRRRVPQTRTTVIPDPPPPSRNRQEEEKKGNRKKTEKIGREKRGSNSLFTEIY